MASPEEEEAWEALTRTDDLLADILIRLPTLADHGRACAAYAAFRRVITSPAFLRRLHALHPPSLLGFRTFTGRFQPVEPPHPAARAVAAAGDFRFSFLPDPGLWVVRDARDGRFLLDRAERPDAAFTTFAVCDPLFRRHVILPPIPQDLAAAVQDPHNQQPHIARGLGNRKCDIFLAPCAKEEEAPPAAGQPQPFRVVWMAQCRSKLVVFVFSSASRHWRAIGPLSWRDLNPALPSLTRIQCLHHRTYAHGCFYWALMTHATHFHLVVLDMDRMMFYHVVPPSGRRIAGEFAMVELRDSRREMFIITRGELSYLRLFCPSRQNHGVGAREWVLENEVSLPASYKYRILGDADGKLILQTRSAKSEPEFGCISLDLKTSQLQKVRGSLEGAQGVRSLFLYIGYPPSLSSSTI